MKGSIPVSVDPAPDSVPAPDADPDVWAAPGLMLPPDPGEPPFALLMIWRRPAAPAPAPALRADLLARGFAQLTQDDLDRLWDLPLLVEASVRLSRVDAHLRIEDEHRAIFDGELAEASAQWRETVLAGRLVVLIDTGRAPTEDEAAGELASGRGIDEWVFDRLRALSRQGVLVGARVESCQA
jgi:hypothetical protein